MKRFTIALSIDSSSFSSTLDAHFRPSIEGMGIDDKERNLLTTVAFFSPVLFCLNEDIFLKFEESLFLVNMTIDRREGVLIFPRIIEPEISQFMMVKC